MFQQGCPVSAISLAQVTMSARKAADYPKGYQPYRPHAKTRLLVGRILERYAALGRADALPAGPRTIGYRLKETHRGEYDKADFANIGRVITRLCQAGDLPWRQVSDASAVDHDPGGWAGPVEFLRDAHN